MATEKAINDVQLFIKRMKDRQSQVKYYGIDRKYNTLISIGGRVYDNENEWGEEFGLWEEVCLVFEINAYSDYTSRLFVSLEDGSVYVEDATCSNLFAKKPLCRIDKEIAKILLPLYKKFYLDGYSKALSHVESECVGIRDGFSVLCNDLGVLPWDCQGDVRKFNN